MDEPLRNRSVSAKVNSGAAASRPARVLVRILERMVVSPGVRVARPAGVHRAGRACREAHARWQVCGGPNVRLRCFEGIALAPSAETRRVAPETGRTRPLTAG